METTYQAFEKLNNAYKENINIEDVFNEFTFGNFIGVSNLLTQKGGVKLHIGFNSVITEFNGEQNSRKLEVAENHNNMKPMTNNNTPVTDLSHESYTILLESLIKAIEMHNDFDPENKISYIY